MRSSAGVWRADYRLRVSHRLIGLMLLGHVLAALAVGLAFIPLAAKLLCWLLLPGLAWHSLSALRMKTAQSVVALREYGEDWWLDTADGQGRRVVLLPVPVLWRHALVLRFAELTAAGQGREYRVPVLPDSLAADDFRRLYVRLKFNNRGPAAAADGPEAGVES